MFKSNDVAYLKLSSFNSRSCILGIGNGFRFIRLFSSRKSDMNLTVPFFFGMLNVDAAHSERFTLRSTSIRHSLSTSVRTVEFAHVFWVSIMPMHDTVMHRIEVRCYTVHFSSMQEFHRTKFHIPVKQ
jgi:hypothetical protein